MTDHGLIRSWIQRDYESVNGISCPWDGSEAAALTKMLKANQSWTPDEWRVMILNYFESEKVNGTRPRVWLPQISKWALGPLDKFGNVKRDRPAHREEVKPAEKEEAELDPMFCASCHKFIGYAPPLDADCEYECEEHGQ